MLTIGSTFLSNPEAIFCFWQGKLDSDESFVTETNLPGGRLAFQVLEHGTGAHLPARLFFLHSDGRPDAPTVGRFKNFMMTASGTETKTIPAGEYDIYASRGIEYTLDHQRVTVIRGQTTQVSFVLSRIVDTSGFVPSDFHLHLNRLSMRDGATMAATEGLDLLTATDHDVHKDYSPYVTELNLKRFVSATTGVEIKTPFGHFNSFPLSDKRWNDPAFCLSIQTPNEMLRLIRENPGDEIVQINHPRYRDVKGGYYNQRLDRETSEIKHAFFETSFDQVEVFNAQTDKSEDGRIGRTAAVEQNLKDWFSLLNRGMLITGVGNSDATRYPSDFGGYPRNYVLSDTDNPWEIDPYRVVDALKRRAVTTSLGPFVRFSANDGTQVGSILTDTDRSVTLHVKVQAAPWIPVEKVEVVANGRVLHSFSVNATSEPTRFSKDIEVNPARDTWYLILVTSNRKWEIPFSNFSSFAFTNPIFIDLDGNGYFDPPNPGPALKELAHARGSASAPRVRKIYGGATAREREPKGQ